MSKTKTKKATGVLLASKKTLRFDFGKLSDKAARMFTLPVGETVVPAEVVSKLRKHPMFEFYSKHGVITEPKTPETVENF